MNIKKLFLKYSLLASLLLHLLLLTVGSVLWLTQPTINDEPAAQFVPSYMYSEKSNAAMSQPVTKKIEADKEGIEKPTPTKLASSTPSTSNPPANQKTLGTSKKVSEDNIELLGDKTKTPKPFVKLLSNALGQHLTYPKIAVDFKIKGTVFVGFLLHPDGKVTDVKVVQTSDAAVLDKAALTAVEMMSLQDVSQYVPDPKFLVIGVYFR